jgi:hypothetical protein
MLRDNDSDVGKRTGPTFAGRRDPRGGCSVSLDELAIGHRHRPASPAAAGAGTVVGAQALFATQLGVRLAARLGSELTWKTNHHASRTRISPGRPRNRASQPEAARSSAGRLRPARRRSARTSPAARLGDAWTGGARRRVREQGRSERRHGRWRHGPRGRVERQVGEPRVVEASP